MAESDSGTYLKVSSWVLAFLLVAGAGFVAWKRHQYEKVQLELRNQIARHESTLEVQKGVYEKKLLEMVDLQKLLDTSQSEKAKLVKELEKQKANVLVLTELSVKQRQDYEAKLSGKQTQVPGVTPGKTRTKVEFEKEFGPYQVSGHTLTDPGEVWLRLRQLRPLRLTLAISQLPDKTWRATVASSEEDSSVEVKLAAVNPLVLQPKWYEGFGFMIHAGGGSLTSDQGAGLLGLSLTYDVKQFSLGPSAWFTTQGHRFYGASVLWRPFRK
jgi:hypothetical protein